MLGGASYPNPTTYVTGDTSPKTPDCSDICSLL